MKFTQSVILVDKCREAVDHLNILRVKQGFSPPVLYTHGLFIDAVNTIAKNDKNNLQKYPLILLIQDFEETIEDAYVVATLNFLIMNKTKSEYNAELRYKHNFVPILLPIYEDFIRSLGAVGFLGLDITKTDHVSVGKGNAFDSTNLHGNEFIDAIGITYNVKMYKGLVCTNK